MKNFINNKILNGKGFAFFTCIVCALFFAPLLYLGKYNHISADCYWFAYYPHVAWMNTHNIFAVLVEAVKESINIYNSWQGTFTSIFMFGLTPGVFGEQYYFIVPYMTIGMTVASTFILFESLFGKIMKFGKSAVVSLTAVCSFIMVEFMDAGTSGLFWYNASIHYVFMQGFTIIGWGLAMQLLTDTVSVSRIKRTLVVAFMTVCSFMASGANFTTALLNAELLTFSVLIAIITCRIKKIKRQMWLVLPWLIGVIGLVMNMIAPGNAVRQAFYPKSSPVTAVLDSFKGSLVFAAEWIDVYVVLILVMLLPIILVACKRTEFRFSLPIIPALILYCLYASMFTPAYYSMSTVPIDRNLNICQMFLYTSLVILEVYFVGWGVKHISAVDKIMPFTFGKKVVWGAILAVCITTISVLFAGMSFEDKHKTATTYIAYYNLHSGAAELMWIQYLARLDQYKYNAEKVLYVEPYTCKPALIFVNDATESSIREDGMLSDLVATWYGKEAIYEIMPEQ